MLDHLFNRLAFRYIYHNLFVKVLQADNGALQTKFEDIMKGGHAYPICILLNTVQYRFLYRYSLVLRHTTEEVLAACMEAVEPARVAFTSHLRNKVMNDLLEGLKAHSWFKGFDISDVSPVRFSLDQWIKQAKELQATVFIAGFFFPSS